jgi:3-oxoacyl-[acyl-carrier protein] reductase
MLKMQKDMICIPESRGLLSKIAGNWPAVGELFRDKLERKGSKAIKDLRYV